MTLNGTHAVVTGGGTGIGLAIAKKLNASGAIVTIMGRNQQLLEKIANEYQNMYAIAVDVADPDSVILAFKKASEINPISILVNNAGYVNTSPFHKTCYNQWQSMIAVNLTGVFLTIKAALSDVKSSPNGRIINISSTAGIEGFAYASAYSAAKHGVIGLTKSLALELKTSSVTVNAICPGYTNTDIVKNAVRNIMKQTGRSEEDALNDLLKSDNQKRLIEPEEIAEKVLWLCDPRNSNINGQAILIAGK